MEYKNSLFYFIQLGHDSSRNITKSAVIFKRIICVVQWRHTICCQINLFCILVTSYSLLLHCSVCYSWMTSHFVDFVRSVTVQWCHSVVTSFSLLHFSDVTQFIVTLSNLLLHFSDVTQFVVTLSNLLLHFSDVTQFVVTLSNLLLHFSDVTQFIVTLSNLLLHFSDVTQFVVTLSNLLLHFSDVW